MVKLGNGSSLSNKIETQDGLKQGCVLAPSLFNLYLADIGRKIDGIESHAPKLGNVPVPIMQYADDIVLLSKTPVGLQRLVNMLVTYLTEENLELNKNKTKVLRITERKKLKYTWTINNSLLEEEDSYKYLGMTIERGNSLADEAVKASVQTAYVAAITRSKTKIDGEIIQAVKATSKNCGLVIALNCWSVSWAANLQTALMFLKLVTITLIIVPGMVALFLGHTENFQDLFDSSSLALEKLPLAFYSAMFAYGGWFFPSYVTEEIVNPERNIPIAVIVSVSIVTVAYVLTNVSYYTILSVEEVLASKAVAMSFADIALKRFSPAIPVLVALSCFGSLNGGIFASARIFFVASREGQWPHLFSMIHIERHTPLPALILMLPLILLMVLIGDLYGLLNFFSCSSWLFIALATLGLVIHRFKYPDLPRPFKVPIFIPVVFTVMSLFIVGMSLYSDPFNTGMGCAIALSGIPLYYLMVKNPRVPEKCMAAFNSLTMKLQVLLTAIPQEIQTF
ncbi:cystine/glutamate transporter-like [Lissotriton helveticus]